MKKITFLVLCAFSVGICTSQSAGLPGGGSSVISIHNGTGGSILFANGVSNTTKSIANLYGLNSIHNGYGTKGWTNTNPRKALTDFERSVLSDWRRVRLFINDLPCILSARYNYLNDEIEVKDGDQLYRLVKENNLQITFLDSNETFIAKSHLDDNGNEVINYFVSDNSIEGIELLKRELVSYISYGKRSKKRFKLVKNDEYYVIRDHKLVDLNIDRKSIKENFPKYSKSLLAFIKTNKLKKNTVENVRKLAEFITSIDAIEAEKTLLVFN